MMDCIRVALSASKHHESQQADQAPRGFVMSEVLRSVITCASSEYHKVLRAKPSLRFVVFEIRFQDDGLY